MLFYSFKTSDFFDVLFRRLYAFTAYTLLLCRTPREPYVILYFSETTNSLFRVSKFFPSKRGFFSKKKKKKNTDDHDLQVNIWRQ